jgi:hypothetical protein
MVASTWGTAVSPSKAELTVAVGFGGAVSVGVDGAQETARRAATKPTVQRRKRGFIKCLRNKVIRHPALAKQSAHDSFTGIYDTE